VFLGVYGFNGKAVNEGQSFLEVGEQQFDESIDVWDDPFAPGSLGLPFDADGTPKQRSALVEGGVSKMAVHDRKTAAKAGTESTAHAVPGAESFGAFPDSVVIGGGDTPIAEMIASVERGLYVATFNYCRILDPKSQVITGLTRNGTFMIENGKITGAVTNMRFTQSFVEAWGEGKLLHLGDDVRFADSEFGVGLVRAPSMHLGAWNFTGGAELLRRLAVVGYPAGHTVDNEIETTFWCSFGIEGDTHRSRVGDVIPHLQPLIELLRTEVDERLPLGEHLPVESVEAEEHRECSNGLGSQDHFVLPRLGIKGTC
jgi:hypothetical protein